jgi:hypothetical protein
MVLSLLAEGGGHIVALVAFGKIHIGQEDRTVKSPSFCGR